MSFLTNGNLSLTLDLNGSWEFAFEENKALEDVVTPGFKATDRMVVPGCYDMQPKWYMKRGTALYRRSFVIGDDVPNAWLVIDGMGLRARFWIDGREIGTDELPWSRVEIPTGALKAGTHVIEAAIDNRVDPKTNRLFFNGYDFYAFGGFYHGVSLSFDNRRLFVRIRDYATGKVEIEAVNFTKTDFECAIVFDGKNEVQAQFVNRKTTVTVPEFRLWSPDEPNLHTVCADGISARFGIREFKTENNRLYLNGKPIFLKGANRHESHLTYGAATPEATMLTDIQNLKALGGNFFRGAHYPQSQRFLDLCDEIGVLVWEESLGWGNVAESKWQPDRHELSDPEFRRLQVEQTRLMVRNSFNHPSVIMFAFLNECQSDHEDCKSLIGELATAIRSEDSGRLIAFAGNRVPTGAKDCPRDISAVYCDVLAFNIYPGWIDFGEGPGTSEELAERIKSGPLGLHSVIERFRNMYPDKPIMVSEMGTCGIYGQHDPDGAQWTEEFQAEYVGDVLDAVISAPELCGIAIWQFTDARSYHRVGPVRCKPLSQNLAGLFDGYRRPKLVAAVVKEKFAKIV